MEYVLGIPYVVLPPRRLLLQDIPFFGFGKLNIVELCADLFSLDQSLKSRTLALVV